MTVDAARADIPDVPLERIPRPRPDLNYAGETRTPKKQLDKVYGRLIVCTGPCGALVDVKELPGLYIDPAEYVCGDCQEAV